MSELDDRRMPVVSSVISQHFDGVSFLWIQRNIAIAASNYDLVDLAKLDNRVEANLDGLRVAGHAGWKICMEALSTGGPGEIFVAAALAFGTGKKDRSEIVLEAVAASPELSRGLLLLLDGFHFSWQNRILPSYLPRHC